MILWGIYVVRKLCTNCQFKSFIHDVRIVRYTAGSRNRLSTSSIQTFIVQTFRSSWLEREKKIVKNQILSYCTTTLLDLDLLAELRILLKETRKKHTCSPQYAWLFSRLCIKLLNWQLVHSFLTTKIPHNIKALKTNDIYGPMSKLGLNFATLKTILLTGNVRFRIDG